MNACTFFCKHIVAWTATVNSLNRLAFVFAVTFTEMLGFAICVITVMLTAVQQGK